MKMKSIEGVITLADGRTSKFVIGKDGQWQQFGAVAGVLSMNVKVIETIADAVREDMEGGDEE